MRNTYRIEIWRYHVIRDQKTFTNKKDAKKWIRDEGYQLMSDYGECFICVYVNDRRLTISEMGNWY